MPLPVQWPRAVPVLVDRRQLLRACGGPLRVLAQAALAAQVGRPFLARRLREWTLLRAIALDESWTAEDLTTASDWFQRTASVVLVVASPEALSLLAERGRTRRVRSAASRRLQHSDQHRPDSIHKS